MRILITGGLLIAAVIHLLPLAGVLGADRLARLYGITVNDPNLVILLRHRAVLFGVLGVLLVLAAFQPALRSAALGAGIVSTASFLIIVRQAGPHSDAIGRVVTADIVALIALLIAAVAQVRLGAA